MKRGPLRAFLTLCLSLLVCAPLLDAQTISFEVLTEFAYPGAHSTIAYGINDAGDVVGAIGLNGVGFTNGFERFADGSISAPLVFPGSGVRDTVATAINNQGTIAGWYTDSEGYPHGFFLSGGVYTSYEHPNAVFGTLINGINDDGDFVGTYSHTAGIIRNFVSVGGKLHEVTIPGVSSIQPTDINNKGDIVGFASSATGSGGFRRESNGALRYPFQRESGVSDVFYGTNNSREAVGQENGDSGLFYGGGTTYVIYNFPNLLNNALTGINRRGVICGYGFSSSELILYSYLVHRVITRTE